MDHRAQTNISSYFSPPRVQKNPDASPEIIDLTKEDDAPPTKKRKVAPSAAVGTRRVSSHRSASPSSHKKSSTSQKNSRETKEIAQTSSHFNAPGPSRKSDPPPKTHRGNDMSDKPKKKTRVPDDAEIGPSGQTCTPLEKQVLELKELHPDKLLLIQEGYKYRFFGEDAKIAAQELGIICYPKRNFYSASIPVERKPIHLKKLLAQGYKVGIVDQTETAALKKGSENKSGLFKRGLTQLFTAATYVDELDSDDSTNFASGAFPSLMCIVEADSDGSRKPVKMGMVTVVPSTGDVIYDTFEDGPLRLELETRLSHLRPHELLVKQNGLTSQSSSILKHFTRGGQATGGGQPRLEEFKDPQNTHSEAASELEEFYENNLKGRDSSNGPLDKWLATIHGMDPLVMIALSHCIKHMRDFGLSAAFSNPSLFQSFHNRNSMLLNGKTLENLEIFRSHPDDTDRGSLFWLVNKTKTAFGSRLLKFWLARPLTNQSVLDERIDAVEELLGGSNAALTKATMLLNSLPDLGKGLSRIQYKQCTPKEFVRLLTSFKAVSVALDGIAFQDEYRPLSPVLMRILETFPTIKDAVAEWTSCLHLNKARENLKLELWRDEDKFPELTSRSTAILFAESDLQDLLKILRKQLKRPTLQYKEVALSEYVIEIPNAATKEIPANWTLLSKTKQYSRYHSPEIRAKLLQREQDKEAAAVEANKAWRAFLGEVCEYHSELRAVVNALGELDCLLSMAQVASRPEYSRPKFTTDGSIRIVAGRHPVAEVIRDEPFVPNSLILGGESPSVNIITGPNMGGKSSVVRMLALTCVMAQVGFYVPALSFSLTPVDCILTRMGASDDLARGYSTFMQEVSETSDILRLATSKSLVILDELGRGTSTFDGMAIASSVLQWLTERTNCKTLFITHYPLIAENLAAKYPGQITNKHMGFIEEGERRTRIIHFLYTLAQGIAPGSYGIECARLAGLPEGLLEKATSKADTMKKSIESKTTGARLRELMAIFKASLRDGSEQLDLARVRDIMRQLD